MGRPSKPDPFAVLRRVLRGEDWVALDIETSDLGPRAELVEIAIVDPAEREVSTLVRPRGGIVRQAARVHRIPPEDIAAAPSFGDVAAAIRQRLARRTVLGYHVDFDRRVLWREFARAGQPAPPCRWMCLCDLMTRWTGRRQSLDRALQRLGLQATEPRHRAVNDALAVVALARALAACDLQTAD
jgi:DNA polymerase III epsilon subunit-like protein